MIVSDETTEGHREELERMRHQVRSIGNILASVLRLAAAMKSELGTEHPLLPDLEGILAACATGHEMTQDCLAPAERRSFGDVPRVGKRGTLLLVDDDPLVLRSARRMLEILGFEVLLAENGSEALEVFQDRSKEIDLVILDLIMPVMDGPETFQRIREVDPDIPIILASGYIKEDKAMELIKFGISGFMQKPLTLDQLSECLDSIMEQAGRAK